MWKEGAAPHLLAPGSEKSWSVSCSQLLEQGLTVSCIHMRWGWGGSQQMLRSEWETDCNPHPGEVIHGKNNQSPSGLQMLSFPKCQQLTSVLLVLSRPLLTAEAWPEGCAENGKCQVVVPSIGFCPYSSRLPGLLCT